MNPIQQREAVLAQATLAREGMLALNAAIGEATRLYNTLGDELQAQRVARSPLTDAYRDALARYQRAKQELTEAKARLTESGNKAKEYTKLRLRLGSLRKLRLGAKAIAQDIFAQSRDVSGVLEAVDAPVILWRPLDLENLEPGL